MLVAAFTSTALAFAPGAPLASSRRSCLLRKTTPVMGPLETLASPLNKWQAAVPAAPAAPAASSIVPPSPLAGLDFPPEVVALFAVIFGVGIIGLVRGSGVLDKYDLSQLVSGMPAAPAGTEAAEGAAPAAPATKDPEDMTQAEQEKLYFKQISGELAGKRGGSKAGRKKAKK